MDDASIVINKGWLVKSPPDLSQSIFKHIKRPKKFLPKWRRRYFELTISDSRRCLAYYNKSAASAGSSSTVTADSRRRHLKGSIDLARVQSVAIRHRPPSNAMATLPTNLIPCRPRRFGGDEALTDSTADYTEEADWLQRCAFSVQVSGVAHSGRTLRLGRRSSRQERCYHFLAESPAAATRWVEALCRACGFPSPVDLGPAPSRVAAATATARRHPADFAIVTPTAAVRDSSEDYVYLSATTTSVFSPAAFAYDSAAQSSAPAAASVEGYANLLSNVRSSAANSSDTADESHRVDSLPLPSRKRKSQNVSSSSSSSSSSSCQTDDNLDVVDDDWNGGGLLLRTNYAQLDIDEMRHASAEALAINTATSGTVAKPPVAMATVEYATVDAMRTLALAEMTSS